MVALLCFAGSPAFANLEVELHDVETELGNVESALSLIRQEHGSGGDVDPARDLERRLVDARVHFALKDHDKASILFLDLVMNKRFQKNRQYPEVVFLLGMALHADGNLSASRKFLEQAASLRSRWSNDALVQLVEIALEAGDEGALGALAGRIAAIRGVAPARLNYGQGKALYRLGKHRAALVAFGAVGPSDEEYCACQYYTGVIHTVNQDFPAAIRAFEMAATMARGDSQEIALVRDNAHLALGRLHLQFGRYDEASAMYEKVDRHSPNFEVALYEMAWVQIARGQVEGALHILEVLLLVAKTDGLMADAHITRGRILSQLDRQDDALGDYKEVIQHFTPIKRELDRLGRSDVRLERYFEWLLRRRSKDYDMARPLTERAAEYLETTDEMKQIVTLFDDIGEERHSIETSHEIIEQLQAALKGARRVEIFPSLRDAWSRLLESDNRFTEVSDKLLRLERRLYNGKFTGAAQKEFEALGRQREKLHQRFLSEVPRTAADFKERRTGVKERLAGLEKGAFIALQLLDRSRDELEAIEQWLAERGERERPGTVDPARERDVRKLIESERKSLMRLQDELVALQNEIALNRAASGDSGLNNAFEIELRHRLLETHRQEAQFLREHRSLLGERSRRLGGRMGDLRRRCWEGISDAATTLAGVQQRIEKGVAKYTRIVRREASRIKKYAKRLKHNERDSQAVAVNVGYRLFRGARDNLRELVLEADVGLIDIVWQRKRSKTERAQELLQERNQRIRVLDDALEEVNRDVRAGSAVPEGQDAEEGGL
jgi:tetratricopeptide (TPR) repeat protein